MMALVRPLMVNENGARYGVDVVGAWLCVAAQETDVGAPCWVCPGCCYEREYQSL